MITLHSEYITHESRLYFMSFPDSRCVYRSIHGHATPLSDPDMYKSKVRYYGEMPATLGTLCACGGKCSLASGNHFPRSVSQIFLRVRGSSPKSVLVFPVQRIEQTDLLRALHMRRQRKTIGKAEF